MKIKRALISVSDKTGLDVLVKMLHALGVEILSTGGTAKRIKELGLSCIEVSDYTGFPEMMDGRVKTLHPKIHGGLLALRENASHMDQARKHNIGMIDMVVINLYPFEKTVSKDGVTLEEAIENIDIGGPSMIRSAAKNYKSVAVLTGPGQYADIAGELKKSKGSLSEKTLKHLASEAFKRTKEYDNAIYNYLNDKCQNSNDHSAAPGASKLTLTFEKIQDLRYGENPHQKAAFYKEEGPVKGICAVKKIQGKELSFNNIMDLNAALELLQEFTLPSAVIIKHTNPSGAASASSLKEAYYNALECDRLSAFGSVVGFNGPVDGKLAEFVLKEADFVECVIAPSFDSEAAKIFSKKKNLRIAEIPDLKKPPRDKDLRKISGGILMQDSDDISQSEKDLRIVTKAAPGKEDLKSLLFSWKIVKHVKSNAIVLSKDTKTVGIGAGQVSRVDSVMIAVRKAGARAKGSVLASDAFFPKPDSIAYAHKAGVKAIIQPGGSIKDEEVIASCDKFGIAMAFTGIRHFKH